MEKEYLQKEINFLTWGMHLHSIKTKFLILKNAARENAFKNGNGVVWITRYFHNWDILIFHKNT